MSSNETHISITCKHKIGINWYFGNILFVCLFTSSDSCHKMTLLESLNIPVSTTIPFNTTVSHNVCYMYFWATQLNAKQKRVRCIFFNLDLDLDLKRWYGYVRLSRPPFHTSPPSLDPHSPVAAWFSSLGPTFIKNIKFCLLREKFVKNLKNFQLCSLNLAQSLVHKPSKCWKFSVP